MREEQAIFDELEALCGSPGFIHAIAYVCFRDNFLSYSGEITPQDMQHLFSKDRLIRTETSTLIGLLLKHDIDYTRPEPHVEQAYVERAEALLKELHTAMSPLRSGRFDPAKLGDRDFNPFTQGEALREPIFYGGESAYVFQYRDFAPAKYKRDDPWLQANKRFSIDEAHKVVHAIARLQDDKATAVLRGQRGAPPGSAPFLLSYTYSVEEVSTYAGLDATLVDRVLTAFSVPLGSRNQQFASLHDFNHATAYPLLRTPQGDVVLLHIYSLVEALYEAPFYWMLEDKAYVPTAMLHRGLFTEEFAVRRLAQVFGPDNVLANIDIVESKTKHAEIDVLVLFGDRAVVLQAKSKRLTLEARAGNDLQLKSDFKRSIQDSCDQAYRCAAALEAGTYKLRDAAGNEVKVRTALKRIYVMCLIADHYPALSFQARQFLQYTPAATTSPPFVMDVFALDAMTEMLASPLHLLSYIDRRTGYTDKLISTHELTILSFHLRQNLWVGDEYDMVMLDDDISSDLDAAMLARRDGLPGKSTPEGFLTRLAKTSVGRLIRSIEHRPDPETLDLGFLLLTLGEDAALDISKMMDVISGLAAEDGRHHNFTVAFRQGKSGLTVHCDSMPTDVAAARLEDYCRRRKYAQRAESWFGVSIHPQNQSPRLGVSLRYPWAQDDAMDELTKGMAKAAPVPSRNRGSARGLAQLKFDAASAKGRCDLKKKKHDKQRAKSQRRNRPRK